MQRFPYALAAVLATAACHAAPAVASPPGDRAGDREGASDDGAADDPEDPDDQLPVVTGATAPTGATGGAALLAEAQRELAAVKSTHYVHHTRVDEEHGVFDVDCSGFVGYALSRVAPSALAAIQAQSKPRPLAKHFEAAFAAIPATGAMMPWVRVDRVGDLLPGDVIAWIEPPENHSRNTGHVMIVAAAPQPSRRAGELTVMVIDSSHSGHGKADPRVRDHRNGLGSGAIVLRVDADGHALGYRWSIWPKSKPFTTQVAFGRLR